MLKLLLWLKYLRQRKLILLSIAAVALSVALLIVVASLFSGFIGAYEQSAVDMLGDVLLQSPVKFTHYEQLIRELESRDTIQTATAVMLVPGLIHVGIGHVRYVQLFGIDPQRLTSVTYLKTSLVRQDTTASEPSFAVPGDPNATGGFVGIGVLNEPNKVTDQYDMTLVEQAMGRKMMLTSGAVIPESPARAEVNPAQFKRRTLSFYVSDVVFTGNYQFDEESVFLPLDTLYRELYPTDDQVRIQRIQIRLAAGADPIPAGRDIARVWDDFAHETGLSDYARNGVRIFTAKELQAQYMQELNKQMGILLATFGIVDCGVIMLIFCIFYMIVRLKQKDIGIVKSCGCSGRTVIAIFLGFGACVGVVGSVLGIGLGLIFTHNINYIEQWIARVFGLNLWDSSVYLFQKIPNQLDWSSVGMISLLAVGAACLGAVIPALAAGRMRPVEILRYE